MASRATLAILFGYAAAFGCLQLVPEAGEMHTTPRQSAFARLAAGALLLPAAVATFGLASLLLCAHVRALGRPDAAAAAGAGAGWRRFVDRLTSATIAAAAAALILLARLLADGVDYWHNAEKTSLSGGGPTGVQEYDARQLSPEVLS